MIEQYTPTHRREFFVRYRYRIAIPFLSTSPVADVGILFLLLPLWWFLGIEQFIWPLGLSWVGWRVLVARKLRVKATRTLKWLFLFLCIHLVSGLFIVESFRWLTFARNFGTYVTALLLVLILTNQVDSWHKIRALLYSVITAMLLAATVGTISILGIWRPALTSVLGFLLPDWITNTTYGGRIAYRNVGQYSWFVSFDRYFRVDSFFMFATLYASALVFSLPISVFMLGQLRGWLRKVIWGGGIALLILNLIYTTGRMAIIGFLIGALYYLGFCSRMRTLIRWLTALSLCLLLLFFLVASNISEEIMSPSSLLTNAYQSFIYARGPGSFLDRAAVYRKTLAGALERPIFGWGTERDIPGFLYPAGSHSYYLGILYKQGIAGLFAFLGIWWALWKETRPPKKLPSSPVVRPLAKFLQYGRWVIIAAMINGLTDVLDLDATTMAIMWLIFALLISSADLLRHQGENGCERP